MKTITNIIEIIFLFTITNSYGQSDALVHVKYAEQSITVGGPEADISDFTSQAIQIAMDALRANGNGLGFHPGTGSDQSIVDNCNSHHNELDGIFLCWRVQNGVFRNNNIFSNGRHGLSNGHQDRDNVFENNHILENGQHGVCFRNEQEINAGHRNVFTKNIIENNGGSKESRGFYIVGETHDIEIIGNIIRATGKGNQITSIFMGKKPQKYAFQIIRLLVAGKLFLKRISMD